ncbi:MAG: helix-turn-helix domain-containing protein [Deltaproteobacteria bacterium]|nr:helix-turn-helix domain-containing protein [Deltaproteobacteria bacterium]
MRFIRISQVESILPVKPSTIYKWRTQRKFSQIFKKLGGMVLIDVQALEELLKGQSRPRGGCR